MNENRVYADREERLRKSGRLIVWCNISVAVLTVLMAGYEPSAIVEGAPVFRLIAGAIMLVCSMVCFCAAYLSELSPEKTAWIEVITVMVIFTFGDLLTGNAFFAFLSYALVLSLFLFYDKKMMRIPAAYVFIFAMITRIGDLFTGLSSGTAPVTVIYGMCFNAMFYVSAISISILTEKYNADIFGTLDDQVEKQSDTTAMLEEVLDSVKKGTEEVSGKLKDIEEATENIALSVSNVSQGTRLTCESVEKQSSMTENISRLIDGTHDNAKEILGITDDVKASVKNGTTVASDLTGISGEIHLINEDVTVAMERLKEKTVAMEAVVDAIAAISGRTNLLALNASIEAARAGDQGRSFSVVAEQIRDLSQQTKESTERIRKLIEELEDEARDASSAVERSIFKAESQQEMIADVEQNFNSIDSGMEILSGDVSAINEKLESLVSSNQSIVDAISQLFAVAEEVTASTDDVLETIKVNKENVTKASEALAEVYDTAMRL